MITAAVVVIAMAAVNLWFVFGRQRKDDGLYDDAVHVYEEMKYEEK